VEHLSADEARRLFLSAQGMIGVAAKRSTPADMLRRMGVVQLDTISVLARSHELVQYSRLGPVARADIEAAYWQRPAVAFEFMAHAFCVIPIEDWPWFAFRRRRPGRHHLSVGAKAYRAVLDRLAEGPASTTELGGAKKGGVWWDWSDAKVAVEHLLGSGHVVCVERRGWTRVYDLPERAIPSELLGVDPSDQECRVELVRRAGRHLGVGTRADLADYYRIGIREVESALDESGLLPVEVRGWGERAWADPSALAALRAGSLKGRHRTTLLSPFDPVVWDRARAERMFGITHRLEAYVPAAKRVYGYFAMPVLSGGRIVGRVDPGRAGKTFVAKRVDVPSAKDVPAVAAAITEAATWVGSSSIAVERVEPASSARALRKALGA
jgi:uncharacterized protein YcaQ